MNKTQIVEYSNRSIFQELNFIMTQLNINERSCDSLTLEKILIERFNNFVADPVDPTRKWWTTIVHLPEFRSQEINYVLKKNDQGVVCVELFAKRQQLHEMDCKSDLKKVICLPHDLEYERIRVLFTVERCVLIKVPFKFTEEQRYNWMNRYMNTVLPTDCMNTIRSRDQFNLVSSTDIVNKFNTRCMNLPTTQLLNGWGPVLTREMTDVQLEIFELLPLMEPYKMIPYFSKDENNKQFRIILDLVLPVIIKSDEVKVQTMNSERRIMFEIQSERRELDGKMEGCCHTRRTFVVPKQVKLEKVESKLMPNGHLRFFLPIELTEKILSFEGETIPVKH